ncbi:hypothetical protein DPMN_058518 [Dreissena polymorpha]|uniref:Uncharacterized protein n=1 Tax=Dreissena polymorpha TaxID=45954 RepID=A0A9D4HDR7_DREPO|nr:hypothetical protein DPMN_058518 [Dreissena polymorpha]
MALAKGLEDVWAIVRYRENIGSRWVDDDLNASGYNLSAGVDDLNADGDNLNAGDLGSHNTSDMSRLREKARFRRNRKRIHQNRHVNLPRKTPPPRLYLCHGRFNDVTVSPISVRKINAISGSGSGLVQAIRQLIRLSSWVNAWFFLRLATICGWYTVEGIWSRRQRRN